ncbi:MAG: toll/interleukin-1 receptor domain-containing protein [Candidatus Thiodiazotropha sp. LLP2]
MKIFLSHKSKDKPLMREFKQLLPPFLSSWLDEESLIWGGRFEKELKSTIQSGVDFLLIFLDDKSMSSAWVNQELEWALSREKELKRTFVLPIILPDTTKEKIPIQIKNRLHLTLSSYEQSAVEALAKKATEKIFQLVLESYANLQLVIPRDKSLLEIRDELSAGQAKRLGFIVSKCKNNLEVDQRKIEQAFDEPPASGENYYRLESLIEQGFIKKRRIPEEGMFTYSLSERFSGALSET